jgi:hypothetical protein
MDEPFLPPEQPAGPSPVKRTSLLTVLCILTFIGSGLNFISSLFIGAFFEQFIPVAQELGERFKLPGIEMITEGKPGFFFFTALLYAGAAVGAALMWKLRKNGFHVYTISQILLVLAPMYFYHLPSPSFVDIFISGAFIVLYATNLKLMT